MLGRMLFLVFFLFSASVSAETSPDVVVRQMVDDVLTPLRQDTGMTRDLQRMDELVDARVFARIDLERLSKLTVGRKNWKEATPEERTQLMGEYHRFLLHAFSDVIAQYTDQTILYLPFRMQPDARDAEVKTVVMDPRDESTELDYKLEKTDQGWLIYDVDIDNMSVIRIYHSNFSDALSEGGVNRLIGMLHEKNLKVEASRK